MLRVSQLFCTLASICLPLAHAVAAPHVPGKMVVGGRRGVVVIMVVKWSFSRRQRMSLSDALTLCVHAADFRHINPSSRGLLRLSA